MRGVDRLKSRAKGVLTSPRPGKLGKVLSQTREDAAGPWGVGASLLYVVGDSWSVGYGLAAENQIPSATRPYADPARAWPSVLAADGRWTVLVEAVSGTGYAYRRVGQDDYLSRIDAPPDTSIVVLQGGLNDMGEPPEIVRAACDATLNGVRAQAPQARVMVLGIPSGTSRSPRHVATFNMLLADCVARHSGVSFVDTAAFNIKMQPDGIHPSRRGAIRFGQVALEAIG